MIWKLEWTINVVIKKDYEERQKINTICKLQPNMIYEPKSKRNERFSAVLLSECNWLEQT